VPEIDVLLAVACNDDSGIVLRRAIARGPDWTGVVQSALHHGTAGLLCRRVLKTAPDVLPDELRAGMEAYLESCVKRQEIAVAELLELVGALSSAGVPALPFKGPALAALAYAEPGLRTCLDLDLLIRESDIGAALAVLRQLGFVSQYPDLRADHRAAYHRYNGQDCLVAPDRIMPVEPHWALAPRSLAVSLDTAPLFRRAQPVGLGGRAGPTLSPEDMLLIAGLHGSKEEWRRLVWVADIAGLLTATPDLDADAVLARATAAGIIRMLLIGIALAAGLLKAPCGGAFAAALAGDPQSLRLAAAATARLCQHRLAPSIFDLSAFRWRMRERPRDRLRYAAATLLTARVKHFRMIELPGPLSRLYPLVRVGHDFVGSPVWRLARARRVRHGG
jgi:hypothetical protein